jgi:hypothetical protein
MILFAELIACWCHQEVMCICVCGSKLEIIARMRLYIRAIGTIYQASTVKETRGDEYSNILREL